MLDVRVFTSELCVCYKYDYRIPAAYLLNFVECQSKYNIDWWFRRFVIDPAITSPALLDDEIDVDTIVSDFASTNVRRKFQVNLICMNYFA